MILLDTNVVSETLRARPDPRVVAWLDAQSAETLHLSAVSLAELLAGVAVLPDGRRKTDLGDAVARLSGRLFRGRILVFDAEAAAAYAAILGEARVAGRAIGAFDAQIAATARAHGMSVATRDASPFEAAGLDVVDPWRQASQRA